MTFRHHPWALSAFVASALAGGFQLATGCSAAPTNTFHTGGSGGSTSTSSATGQGGDIGIGIDGGLGGSSSSGGVPQTCADALKNRSYIGCEYWPTVTSNAGLYESFEFAVAAANPTGSPAMVTVERNGNMVAQVTVQPGGLETISLPWVDELKGFDTVGDGSGIGSVFSKKGAYKLSSSVPITLWQFNPLEFQLATTPSDCPNAADLGGCFSFTNDASILLPTTALRNEYYVMSYPTMHLGQVDPFFGDTSWINLPGFVAITATEDNTQVTVESTANVRAGSGVAALSSGQTGTFKLNAGDVLQLTTASGPASQTPQPGKPCQEDPLQSVVYCPSAATLDLTGSHIVSDKPVSVIGGHDCTFIPFNKYACDHIEESLFPVETLGKDLIVTAPKTVDSVTQSPGQADNMFVRVLSAADNNEITFDPPVAAKTTLQKGKWVEIGPITQDFRVMATDRIMVGQYMVGENFGSVAASAGDPSLSIAIPTEQYRVEYTFLAPSTYTYNVVNVVTKTGANITIDGATIPQSEFVAIGSSGMSVARHLISGGTHKMVGSANFGIVVYGYGSYTSYMYPGGLNLETVVIVPQ
ncbi:Hemagglutinin/hemolysin-related protein [Minicystis rosea]|nr:Hemagglutinin/hemolysin-related protein [Minicystis rosea]